MPRLTDKHDLRRILQRDPRWCVYALGDLSPRMFAKCQWFTPDLTLVLHDYGAEALPHEIESLAVAVQCLHSHFARTRDLSAHARYRQTPFPIVYLIIRGREQFRIDQYGERNIFAVRIAWTGAALSGAALYGIRPIRQQDRPHRRWFSCSRGTA